MADQSKNQLKSRLAGIVRDLVHTTWTDTELDEALKQAIDNDNYLTVRSRDTSLSTVSGQVVYSFPDSFQSLDRLEIDYDGSGFSYPLSRLGWEEGDGEFYLTRHLQGIPEGKTLIFWGLRKLTSTDLIPDRYQNYVLHNAAIVLLEDLIFSKTGKFLKNDTTMSEIMQAIQYCQGKVRRLEQSFSNRNSTDL